MRYKHLDSAGVDLSVLGVGTWALGNFGYGTVTEKDSINAIHAMFEHGVNLIDTAPVYGEGCSEEVVGKALKGCDRTRLLISSKFGIGNTTAKQMRYPSKEPLRDGSYPNVLFECEQSLRRLGTDYIDFYFVHWPDYDTPLAETMEALNTLKAQGKIRFIGLSNFDREQIQHHSAHIGGVDNVLVLILFFRKALGVFRHDAVVALAVLGDIPVHALRAQRPAKKRHECLKAAEEEGEHPCRTQVEPLHAQASADGHRKRVHRKSDAYYKYVKKCHFSLM